MSNPIPFISDEEIARRLPDVKFLTFRRGVWWSINTMLVHPRNQAFTWDSVLAPVEAPVQSAFVDSFETYHTGVVFFKPSVAECLAQLPEFCSRTGRRFTAWSQFCEEDVPVVSFDLDSYRCATWIGYTEPIVPHSAPQNPSFT